MTPVVFVHIPRTAGTSFGRLLDAVHAGRPIETFYGDPEHPVVNAKIERFRALPPPAKAAIALVRGHVVYRFDPAFDDAHHVTLLREPLARLVSYYHYALRERHHYLHDYLMQRRLGLEDFLGSDASIDLDNYQVRAVCGRAFASPRERVTQADCDVAKYRLAHGFKAFGLTERFDDSLALFSRTLGWQLPGPVRVNTGAYDPRLEVSAACRSRFLEKNRFDQELHEFARDLFESRFAAASSPEHTTP